MEGLVGALVRRGLAGWIVAACTIAALSGCSSGSSGDGATNSALGQSLRQVADTPGTRSFVAFSKPGAGVAADGGSATAGAYAGVWGIGLGDLATYSTFVERTFGIDVTSADAAVQAGIPPNLVTAVTGLDLGRLGGKLTDLGATKRGDTYRLAPDNAIRPPARLAKTFESWPGLNVLSLADGQLSVARNSAALTQVTSSHTSLADNPVFADLSSCLGDPLAAYLTDTLREPRYIRNPAPPSPLPSSTAGLTAVGAGTSGAKGHPPTELLCLRADTTQHARAIASSVTTALAHGSSLVTRQAWSTLVSGARVTRDDKTVKVTAHPAGGQRAGMFLRTLEQQDLPGVFGAKPS